MEKKKKKIKAWAIMKWEDKVITIVLSKEEAGKWTIQNPKISHYLLPCEITYNL